MHWDKQLKGDTRSCLQENMFTTLLDLGFNAYRME